MRALLFATALFATATAANAETISFHAMLNGASEVPANSEKGTGMAMGSLDTVTKVFSYDVTYSGLTGPATAAHFHGPAAPGANAGPVVPIASPASPIKGQATLTDPQIADLTAGKWYVNVHTAAHGGGEIRGQVEAMK
jgi:hypothetical protein